MPVLGGSGSSATSGQLAGPNAWTGTQDFSGATVSGIAGGGSVLSSSQTPLLRFYAAAAARDVQPVIVAVAGDSFSANLTASLGWATKLLTFMQREYPKLTGSEVAINADLTTARASRSPGVQVVNAAVGGTTSANFLTGTTTPQLAALQPNLHLWCIGENDPANGITAAQHKTNLLSLISTFKATGQPQTFVLVHAYKRPSGYQAGWEAWENYGTAEAQIAAADPENVVYIDLSTPFAFLGVPGEDPLALVGSDGFHPSSSGMALFADLVWGALRSQTATTKGALVTVPSASVPGQPGTPTAGTVTATTIPITWTAVSRASSYKVEYRTSPSGSWTTATTFLTATAYTVTGLTGGTAYDVRVTAYNLVGYGTASSPVTATPGSGGGDNTAPSVPTGLTVGTVTSSTVPLTWTASTDNVAVTGYNVYRGGTLVGTSATAAYTDTGLASSTAYTYTVAAYDAAGNTSAQSSSVNATTSAGGGGGGGGGGLTDTFDRTDSASSLGTPSDGGTGYTVTGTWGINGNAAYFPGSAVKNYAVRPVLAGSAASNASAEATITGSGINYACVTLNNPGSSGSGYVLFGNLNAASMQLWKVDAAASFTAVGTATGTFAAGDTLKLVKTGSSLQVYKNGVAAGSAFTDTTYPTVTHGGIFLYQPNTTARFDNLTVSGS